MGESFLLLVTPGGSIKIQNIFENSNIFQRLAGLVPGPAWSQVWLGPWSRSHGPWSRSMVPGPWSVVLVPGPWSWAGLVPGPAWFHGPWSLVLVPGPWPMVPGPWSLVRGPWSLAHGPWSVVPGPWSLVPEVYPRHGFFTNRLHMRAMEVSGPPSDAEFRSASF